jgi:hypothetical protein
MDHKSPFRDKINDLLERTLNASTKAEPGGLLPKIAKELIGGGDAAVTNDLVSVLQELFAQQKLDLPLAALKAKDFKPEFANLASTALTEILTSAGHPGLAVASKAAVKLLKSRIDGCGVLRNHKSLPGPGVKQENGQDVILYFVEMDNTPAGNALLPEVNGSKTLGFGLLQKGFMNWGRKLDLVVNLTSNQQDANLLVTGAHLGKNSSVLARTEIGPPQGRQLRMVFNLDKTDLTPDLFESNVAHEFGHALGIVHEAVVQDGTQVMHAMLLGVKKPQGPGGRSDLDAAVFQGWRLHSS